MWRVVGLGRDCRSGPPLEQQDAGQRPASSSVLRTHHTHRHVPGLMEQVENTRLPPGLSSPTATPSSLRWYCAVCCSSRRVWRCTSLRAVVSGWMPGWLQAELWGAVATHPWCKPAQSPVAAPQPTHRGRRPSAVQGASQST